MTNSVLTKKKSGPPSIKMKKSRSSFIDLNVENSETNSLRNFEELEQNVRDQEKISQVY